MISTLSPKNQTTISAKYLRQLGLHAGAKFNQRLEAGKIILEPLGDVLSAFGALKHNKIASIDEETEAAEQAMAQENL